MNEKEEFAYPDWHSKEAKEAWADRIPRSQGDILLPPKDADLWAMGYDQGKADIEGRYDFDANGW